MNREDDLTGIFYQMLAKRTGMHYRDAQRLAEDLAHHAELYDALEDMRVKAEQ